MRIKNAPITKCYKGDIDRGTTLLYIKSRYLWGSVTHSTRSPLREVLQDSFSLPSVKAPTDRFLSELPPDKNTYSFPRTVLFIIKKVVEKVNSIFQFLLFPPSVLYHRLP